MAVALTAVIALVALVAVGLVDARSARNSGGGINDRCVTKVWGDTSGTPVTIQPLILPAGVSDENVKISDPCPLGKAGIIATVCDPDLPPDVDVYSADLVHVHRSLPLNDAVFKGAVFCRRY